MLLFSAFFLVAFVYASVGFGGGSSYIAILALSGLAFGEIKLTSMVCNIAVVLGNTALFRKSDWWDGRKYLPFIVAGMPMAFLGALIPLKEQSFFVLLGATLLLSAMLLWIQPGIKNEPVDKAGGAAVRDGIAGGSIGLLSGLVGIGGGIFLSPLLYFLRWDTARHISAATSLFILANSGAGLAGRLISEKWDTDVTRLAILVTAVVAGGQLGVRVSLRKFSPLWIRRITAVLVFWAGTEVLWKYLR